MHRALKRSPDGPGPTPHAGYAEPDTGFELFTASGAASGFVAQPASLPQSPLASCTPISRLQFARGSPLTRSWGLLLQQRWHRPPALGQSRAARQLLQVPLAAVAASPSCSRRCAFAAGTCYVQHVGPALRLPGLAGPTCRCAQAVVAGGWSFSRWTGRGLNGGEDRVGHVPLGASIAGRCSRRGSGPSAWAAPPCSQFKYYLWLVISSAPCHGNLNRQGQQYKLPTDICLACSADTGCCGLFCGSRERSFTP